MPQKYEYRPYLETTEEVLVRFRTDTVGMEIIRGALFETACHPAGLDEEDDSGTLPRNAEELLTQLPSVGGQRRPAEDRLRKSIKEEREKRLANQTELLRRASDAARESVRRSGTATAEELAVAPDIGPGVNDETVVHPVAEPTTVDPVVEEQQA